MLFNSMKGAVRTRNLKLWIIMFSVMLISIIVFSGNKIVYAIPEKPTQDIYVQDYAGILEDKVKTAIMDSVSEINRETGAQICVVTVKSLDGVSVEEYSKQIFNSWGIGDKVKNNGVLLLVSINDKKIRIEVGSGIASSLTSEKTDKIIELMEPYFKNNNYSNGVMEGFNHIAGEVCDVYGIPSNYSETKTEKSSFITNLVPNFLSNVKKNISFIIILIFTVIIFIKNKIDKGNGSGWNNSNNDSFNPPNDSSWNNSSSNDSFGGGSSDGGGSSGGW